MIPARVGSKRVKNKVFREIAGKPLIQYAIDVAKQVKGIDEIYINSPDEIFKPIAEKNNIKFFKRPFKEKEKEMGDDFVYEFCKFTDADYIIMVNSVAPCITREDVEGAVAAAVNTDADTLHSVERDQIEVFYMGEPLNFDKLDKSRESQTLNPIERLTFGIVIWKRDIFIRNYKLGAGAWYGYPYGHAVRYQLHFPSTVDIDTEDDLALAEAIIRSKPENI